MPFRLNDLRAKIQFVAPASFPNLIYQACLATDTVSNTRYLQEALCDALARDLGLDRDDLMEQLPTPWGPAAVRRPRDGRYVPHPERPREDIR
jgi:hypothetical protein